MSRLAPLLDLLAAAGRAVTALGRRWPLAAAALWCLLAALLSYLLFDRFVALWFKQHLPGSNWEGFFKIVTTLGLGGVWLIPPPPLWLACRWQQARAAYGDEAGRWRRRADALLYFFLTVALSGLFVDAVKVVVGRYRPRALFEQGLYGFHPFSAHWAINSFPSGHSQTIFAAMMALAVIVPRYNRAWLLLAALVAFSRVATSVHYLSDVIMGSYIGICAALLMHRAFRARGIEVRLGACPCNRTRRTAG